MHIASEFDNNVFINNVVTSCSELIFNELFESKLDIYSYIIAFTNRVYDLNESRFRSSEP